MHAPSAARPREPHAPCLRAPAHVASLPAAHGYSASAARRLQLASHQGGLLTPWRPPQPHAITARKMGVGACMWEGELVLAAYLGGRVAGARARACGGRVCAAVPSGPGRCPGRV
jgi:hypothetical protein